MTNFEILQAMATYFEGADVEWHEEATEFCTKQMAAITRKNEKARERSAAKRAAGDELRGRIEEALGEEPMTVSEIMDALGDEDLTPSKVVARLTQLVKAEKAAKEQVNRDGRKLMAYHIA